MITSKVKKHKYVVDTIREKMKKSGKMLTFSYFFGRYGVKPLNA
jgi:hypothetical protein